jgi:hypothetical protein
MAKILFSIILSVGALSASADTICSNGTIEQQGDGYYQITLLEDGIEFAPYESSYVVDIGSIEHQGGLFTIKDKTVNIESEGEELEPKALNAMLIYDVDAQTLNAAISLANGPFEAYEMTCKEN